MKIIQKTIIYLSILPLVFLSACFLDEGNDLNEFLQQNISDIEKYIADNNIDAQQTESGLYYAITEENSSGQALEAGNRISIHYESKLVSGVIFDSSSVYLNKPQNLLLDIGFLFDDPEFFPDQTRLLPVGLNEGLKLLKTGEKATFIMPNTLGFGASSNSVIPPFSVLIYEVEILDTQSEEELITKYITDNTLTVTETGTGLRYATEEAGLGEVADDADVVTLRYTGRMLDGFEFDSSDEFTYTVDDDSPFVEGWKEAMKLFPVGYKGQIIFPSSLGYGASGQLGSSGQYDIPPYTPLIFEIEIINIERN